MGPRPGGRIVGPMGVVVHRVQEVCGRILGRGTSGRITDPRGVWSCCGPTRRAAWSYSEPKGGYLSNSDGPVGEGYRGSIEGPGRIAGPRGAGGRLVGPGRGRLKGQKGCVVVLWWGSGCVVV